MYKVWEIYDSTWKVFYAGQCKRWGIIDRNPETVQTQFVNKASGDVEQADNVLSWPTYVLVHE